MPSEYANSALHVMLAFAAFYKAVRAIGVQKLIENLSSESNAFAAFAPDRAQAKDQRRAMTTELPQRTAKIYQFPTRARKPLDQSRGDAASLLSTPAPSIVADSGWYHDAAIQEAKNAREH